MKDEVSKSNERISDEEEEEEEEDNEEKKKKISEQKKKDVRVLIIFSKLSSCLEFSNNFLYFLQDDETKELAKAMMSKKAARLYGRMQHGINKKQEIVAELHRRRQEIQVDKNNKGRTIDGKTILKAKVERLKSERKSIEKEYEKSASNGTMKKKKRRANKM